MWKCSNCDQESSRRWNLETHIKRKHDGLGEPINSGNSGRDFISTQVGVYNGYKDYQYQNNGKLNTFKPPFRKSKKSLKESLGFVDEIYDLIHKFSEVKEFINHNSPSKNQFVFPLTLPSRGLSFPSLTQLQYSPIALPPIHSPSMCNVIAYRGYVCSTCFMKYINPVYGLENTGKIVEEEHRCHDGTFLGRANLLGAIIPDFIKDLYQRLAQELRDIVNLWTENRPFLISEFVPVQPNCINLKIPNDSENNWISRAIRQGRTSLNDIELVDFLCSSCNQTYNCFNTYSEQDGSTCGSVFMYISKRT